MADNRTRVLPSWGDEELGLLDKGGFEFDSIGLRGRDETIGVIQGVVSNLLLEEQQQPTHGAYTILIASGHVRSGKTRIGQEVFQIVSQMIAPERKALYVPVNLGNGQGFESSFDAHVTPSEALGARMVHGYFATTMGLLKAISAAKAIDVIAAAGEGRHRRPIVVHVDEHCQYIREYAKYLQWQSMDRDADEDDFLEQGRQKVAQMLDALVAIATAPVPSQRRTLIVVLSGTSLGDVVSPPPQGESMYQLVPLKLPVLNPQLCRELAWERIDWQLERVAAMNLRIPWPEKATVVRSPLLEVALADTGGLPGWVVELGGLACSYHVYKTESYVRAIHDAVKQYHPKPTNPKQIERAVLVGLARPPLVWSSELLPDVADTSENAPSLSGRKRKRRAWTVQDACDSGSIHVVETTKGSVEIRIPAAVMASYRSFEQIRIPCDIDTMCGVVTNRNGGWTWQHFQSAHICYLAAVLQAIAATHDQFWTRQGHTLTLSNVLSSVSPSSHAILEKVLTPQGSFDALDIIKDGTQCIPRETAKSKVHMVNTTDLDHMHQALAGTPIIDAYVNLKLCGGGESLAAGTATVDESATLFIQYKHSKLEPEAQVKISEMNDTVTKLETYLSGYESHWGGRPWIFLWVTNRAIVENATPHPHLLWVGKDNLMDHAPLIGRRGLIPKEDERIDY